MTMSIATGRSDGRDVPSSIVTAGVAPAGRAPPICARRSANFRISGYFSSRTVRISRRRARAGWNPSARAYPDGTSFRATRPRSASARREFVASRSRRSASNSRSAVRFFDVSRYPAVPPSRNPHCCPGPPSSPPAGTPVVTSAGAAVCEAAARSVSVLPMSSRICATRTSSEVPHPDWVDGSFGTCTTGMKSARVSRGGRGGAGRAARRRPLSTHPFLSPAVVRMLRWFAWVSSSE